MMPKFDKEGITATKVVWFMLATLLRFAVSGVCDCEATANHARKVADKAKELNEE